MTCFVLLLSTAFGQDLEATTELIAPALNNEAQAVEAQTPVLTMHEFHSLVKFTWQDFQGRHEEWTQTATDPEELGRRRVEDMTPSDLMVAIPQAIEQYALATYDNSAVAE